MTSSVASKSLSTHAFWRLLLGSLLLWGGAGIGHCGEVDRDLTCRIEQILVGAVKSVSPPVGTQANPPRVTLEIKMTLKGPETTGELTGIWAPAPAPATPGEAWNSAPCVGPSIGKPWVVLVEKQGEDLVFLESGRGLASRSHIIQVTEALECGTALQRSFPSSSDWMEDLPATQETGWKDIELDFLSSAPGEIQRRFSVQGDGVLTLRLHRAGTQKVASQTRRVPPDHVETLIQELVEVGVFQPNRGQPRQPSPLFSLRVKARRVPDGERFSASLSCTKRCPKAIQRAHGLLGILWKKAQ